MELILTDAARQHLAEVGYDPVYGARPLKRVIQRQVQDPLALSLLRGEFDRRCRHYALHAPPQMCFVW